jgi:hypothetical protein
MTLKLNKIFYTKYDAKIQYYYIVILWVMTPCNLVGGYRSSEGTRCLRVYEIKV